MKARSILVSCDPVNVVEIAAVELGVVIGKDGRDIHQANADFHIAGYGGSAPTHSLLPLLS